MKVGLLLVLAFAVTAGALLAGYQRTEDRYRMSDHKIYAQGVAREMDELRKMQIEFLARQKLNRTDIQELLVLVKARCGREK